MCSCRDNQTPKYLNPDPLFSAVPVADVGLLDEGFAACLAIDIATGLVRSLDSSSELIAESHRHKMLRVIDTKDLIKLTKHK